MQLRQNFHIRISLVLGIALVAASAAALATSAGAEDTTLGPRIDALFSEYDAWDRPGMAVAVVRDGELIYARGYGCANLEYDIPITPATVFHVASVSKQFTCFAVLLLADDGKLSLDDDVRKYVPDVPDFGQTITLRHLMNHNSGLRDQWALLALAGWRLDDVITRDHIMKLVRRQRELNFPPGSEHLYCNTGYTLLAEVVANVSGKSFREFTTERIFKPLGMTHSHFHDSHEEIVPNRAYSYEKDKDGYRKSVLSYANVGATSLFTTAEDLARWLTHLDAPRVGSPGLVEQMQTPGVLSDGKTIKYGLGLALGKYGGQKTIGHSGADAGFRSDTVRFPESKLGIVVLSNLASADPSGAARKIAAVVLGDALKPEGGATAKSKEPTESDDAKEPAKPVDVPLATLQKYVGTYKLSSGAMAEVKLDGGRLFGELPGGIKLEMIPFSATEFSIQQLQARVKFPETDAEHVDSFTANAGGETLEAKRVTASEPVDVAEFAGKYTSDELLTSYELVVEGDKLIARHQRNDDIQLTPTGKDEFAGSTWFFQTAKFQRDADGKITGLLVSDGRVRNLKFDRQ